MTTDPFVGRLVREHADAIPVPPVQEKKPGTAHGDGALRGIHRVAVAEPNKMWPASVVADLAADLIRERGTDVAWIALHGGKP